MTSCLTRFLRERLLTGGVAKPLNDLDGREGAGQLGVGEWLLWSEQAERAAIPECCERQPARDLSKRRVTSATKAIHFSARRPR